MSLRLSQVRYQQPAQHALFRLRPHGISQRVYILTRCLYIPGERHAHPPHLLILVLQNTINSPGR